VQAAGTYAFYCGRYEFPGETVVHHLELSLLPNWVGVHHERLVEVAGNRLALSTRPILLGASNRVLTCSGRVLEHSPRAAELTALRKDRPSQQIISALSCIFLLHQFVHQPTRNTGKQRATPRSENRLR
jgi:hypothetical protein